MLLFVNTHGSTLLHCIKNINSIVFAYCVIYSALSVENTRTEPTLLSVDTHDQRHISVECYEMTMVWHNEPFITYSTTLNYSAN